MQLIYIISDRYKSASFMGWTDVRVNSWVCFVFFV